MKQVTIKGFVYEVDFKVLDKSYVIFSDDNASDQYYTLIGPAEFTYTIPADFNPVARKVEALQKEKERIGAEFAAKVREIDEQIGKLQALPMAEVA